MINSFKGKKKKIKNEFKSFGFELTKENELIIPTNMTLMDRHNEWEKYESDVYKCLIERSENKYKINLVTNDKNKTKTTLTFFLHKSEEKQNEEN